MEEIDWPKLTDDLLEEMVITQSDLAERCQVTQQSISNWKNGVRCPGGYAREKLFELLEEAGLEKGSYKLEEGAVSRKRPKRLHTSLPEDVAGFAIKLSTFSKKKRAEAIAVAEFILDHK